MTSDGLFDISEAWDGDPLRPDMVTPTPDTIVARLSANDRAMRVRNLTAQAHDIHDLAVAEHAEGHRIVGTVVLYSGGNDSTTLAHLFKRRATHAAHANTGIGIEETRQFVRDTTAAWGIPLIEKHPPMSYRDLVIERGFPGPAMHYKMYTRLKERCLDQVRADLVKNGRRERVVFLAGRRRAESARRVGIPLHERRRSVIWASPIALWTSLDLNTYRTLHDVPRNPVSDRMHMSGECLCGAFAHPGELDEIGYWYPNVRAEIEQLEADVRSAGHPEALCKWGNGQGKPSEKTGALCSSCTLWDEAAA